MLPAFPREPNRGRLRIQKIKKIKIRVLRLKEKVTRGSNQKTLVESPTVESEREPLLAWW